jgi:hypothetical protein
LIIQCKREYYSAKKERRSFDWNRVKAHFPGRSSRGLALVWKRMKDLVSLAGSQETLSGTIHRGGGATQIKTASQHVPPATDSRHHEVPMTPEDINDLGEILSQMQEECQTIDDAANAAAAAAVNEDDDMAGAGEEDADEDQDVGNDLLNTTAELETQLDSLQPTQPALDAPMASASSEQRPLTQLDSPEPLTRILERADTLEISREFSVDESVGRNDSDDFLPDKIRLVQSPVRPTLNVSISTNNQTQVLAPPSEVPPPPALSTQQQKRAWTAEDEEALEEAVKDAISRRLKGPAKWEYVASKINQTPSAVQVRHSYLKNKKGDKAKTGKRKSFDGKLDDAAPPTKKVNSSATVAAPSTVAPKRFTVLLETVEKQFGDSDAEYEAQTQQPNKKPIIIVAETPQEFFLQFSQTWIHDLGGMESDSLLIRINTLGAMQAWSPVLEMSPAEWDKLPTCIKAHVVVQRFS